MPITIIATDEQFQNLLSSSGGQVVVVDFTASWCGPCQMIAPVFEELSNRYANDAKFLKVDVDLCQSTARSQNVSSMPTFVFYRNRQEIHRFSGANSAALESKIKEEIALNPAKSDDCGIPGHFNLIPTMIVDSSCECLNEADDHPLSNCLNSDTGFLESDVDEQLILSLTFSQSVRLHSIAIKGPSDKGVKHIRIFINQPQTLDFDQVSSRESVQDITFSKDDITSGKPVPLKYVKFQNVQNILIFVQNNQADTETTVIQQLKLIGSPISTTDMSSFKRITGKKDERH